jgi:hypothetical protein
MAKYKVIALSVGGLGNKIFSTGDIVTESNFLPGVAEAHVKGGFLELISSDKKAEKSTEKKSKNQLKKEAKAAALAAEMSAKADAIEEEIATEEAPAIEEAPEDLDTNFDELN